MMGSMLYTIYGSTMDPMALECFEYVVMKIKKGLTMVPTFEKLFFQWPFQKPIYWRYLPYIRPIFQAYVRGYTPKIGILKFPLIFCIYLSLYLHVWTPGPSRIEKGETSTALPSMFGHTLLGVVSR